MKFKELGINEKILRVLEEQEYKEPTPIQEKTIPAAMAGSDVLGLAQTGSGKTASFAIPTLENLSKQTTKSKHIKALVLTPTRELAVQIMESFDTYGKYLSLRTVVVFGGVSQQKQERDLNKGADVLVATPGRLLDLINQGIVDLSNIDIFILDEADRMLDMGFAVAINKLLKILPEKKQTLLFSATMPKEIETIVKELLHEPVTVKVTPVSSTVDTIEQSVIYVDRNNKINLLLDFFKDHHNQQVLIFARTKRGSDKLLKDLTKYGMTAKAIHGDKSQNARQIALKMFKNNEIQALIATDIVSRGIDINELKYVINYDLPEQAEDYVHRIGRTGRAGNSGEAISYCSYQEIALLKDIEKLTRKKIRVEQNDKYPLVDKTEKEKKTNKPRSGNKKPKSNVDFSKKTGCNRFSDQKPKSKGKRSYDRANSGNTSKKQQPKSNSKRRFTSTNRHK